MLYEKTHEQVASVTIETLNLREDGCYLLFDAHAMQHFMYQKDEGKILRYPTRRIQNNPPTILGMCHHFEFEHRRFSTTPFKVKPPHFIFEPDLFLTPEEIAVTVQAVSKGEVVHASTDFCFDSNFLLTKEQQQHLCHGALFPVAGQTFFEYMESLPSNVLEACIRTGNCDDLSLTEADTIEVRAFRYTFLNPVTINSFSLSGAMPTIGTVFDYFIHTIKNYLIHLNPTREAEIRQLSVQTLTKSHALKIGQSTTEFDEGIYNPQGLMANEDKLFRATILIIGAREDGLRSTVSSLCEHEFKTSLSRLNWLKFLDQIVSQPNSQANYVSIQGNINAVYPDFADRYWDRLIYAGALINNSLAPEVVKEWLGGSDYFAEYCQSPALYLIRQSFILLQQENILTEENRKNVLKHRDQLALASTIKTLQQAGMLNQENLNKTLPYQNLLLTSILKIFYENGCLNQPNFLRVIPYSRKEHLIKLLKIAVPLGPLTQETLDLIITASFSDTFIHQLRIFGNDNILTIGMLQTILQHPNPQNLEEISTILYLSELHTLDNLNTVITHPNLAWLHAFFIVASGQKRFPITQVILNEFAQYQGPRQLEHTLITILKEGLFTLDELRAIAQHKEPLLVARILHTIRLAELQTPESLTLIVGHPNLPELDDSLARLKDSGLLNQNNLDAILVHNEPRKLMRLLKLLHPLGLLTPENRNVLSRYENPETLADTLLILWHTNLLNQVNFENITRHPNLGALSEVLTMLRDINLCIQENLEAIAHYNYPDALKESFEMLTKKKLLNQKHLIIILKCCHPKDLIETTQKLLNTEELSIEQAPHNAIPPKANASIRESLCLFGNRSEPREKVTVVTAPYLQQAELPSKETGVGQSQVLARILETLRGRHLFTSENQVKVLQYGADLEEFECALERLIDYHLLDQNNLHALTLHKEPLKLARLLKLLSSAKLLTPENRNEVTSHPHPDDLADSLRMLFQTALLNQTRFQAIMKHSDAQELRATLESLLYSGRLDEEGFNSAVSSNIPGMGF